MRLNYPLPVCQQQALGSGINFKNRPIWLLFVYKRLSDNPFSAITFHAFRNRVCWHIPEDFLSAYFWNGANANELSRWEYL